MEKSMSEYDREPETGAEDYEAGAAPLIDECLQYAADLAETAREFVRRNPALLVGVVAAVAAGVMLLGASRRRAVE
jgi:ElaB/YqjD/DUF883 family membrane-anchored ribosome-binding protein